MSAINKIELRGQEYQLNDNELRTLFQQLITQIASNNSQFSEHINDLNDRLVPLENLLSYLGNNNHVVENEILNIKI